MKKWDLDREFILNEYFENNLSIYSIAKTIGCSPATIKRFIAGCGYSLRNKKECGRLLQTGKNINCLVCGKVIYRKKSQLEKFDKFFCSWDCAKEFQATGSDNFRVTREYKDWRNRIIKRDVRCVLCGFEYNLVAHHIIEVRHDPTLKLETDNGITLCEECHKKVHREDSRNFIKPLQEAILVEKLRISVKV